MKKRIWFNRWFSTAYHYINMIKDNPDGMEFEIYGTYPNKDAIYLQACDHIDIEPDIEGSDYVDFCLNYCKENKIDFFLPRKEIVSISKRLTEFNEIGTKVLASPNVEFLQLVNDKVKFYESIKDKNIVVIPTYYVVNNAEDFKLAYHKLKEKNLKVCFKPVIGEGAIGFRFIDDKADLINNIFSPPNYGISFNRAYELFSQTKTFQDLMVLEYLEEDEYSIDCLAYDGHLYFAIPRKKAEGRVRIMEYKPELIEIAKKIAKEYNISYAFNVQVKYNKGVPKLLEINPRMSGGLHISCLTGVNIPYLALKLLMDGKIEEVTPRFNVRASQIETQLEIK